MGALSSILIVAYLLIVVAMIAVILLQRSEGGGLGMGTSSNNGLVSVRGSANLLTRTTAILAALFFAMAMGLTLINQLDRGTDSILNNAVEGGTQPTTVLDALQQMQQQSAGDLPVPATTPADPAAPATPSVDTSLPTPAPTDAAPATAPAAETPAAPAESAPASTTPAAPATTEQPAAPQN